ncbi:MAG: hypothetical protein GEV08_05545 [Acidimicrobiia bacterium]|nr:hypothetical protein [Acidimicrobiia bacterium]
MTANAQPASDPASNAASNDRLRVVPTSQLRPLDPSVRAAVEGQRTSLVVQLRAVDRSLAALAKERRRLLDRLAETTQRLVVPADWSRGRRPGMNTLEDPLSPLPEEPTWLFGRRLRAVSLRLLQRCGVLPLRQLHALLHLHGFGVMGAHPVKALADALGHEADVGNALREARGRYRASPGYRPRTPRHLFLEGVALPDVDE